jgi:hypothetical protein
MQSHIEAKSTKIVKVSIAENEIIKKDTPTEIKQELDSLPHAGITIKFPEFRLVVDSLEIWDEDGKLKGLQKDTVFVSPELGEVPGTIRLINCQFDQVIIYQRFENSVTVMNEGPHCDLIDWKHFTSEWKKIKKLGKYQFKTNSISMKEQEKFIPVDMDEFKLAVKEYCGEGWYELVKEAKSVHEYPCGIGTSKIELKIVLKDKETNQTVEKLIVFDVPMGC